LKKATDDADETDLTKKTVILSFVPVFLSVSSVKSVAKDAGGDARVPTIRLSVSSVKSVAKDAGGDARVPIIRLSVSSV